MVILHRRTASDVCARLFNHANADLDGQSAPNHQGLEMLHPLPPPQLPQIIFKSRLI